MDRPFSMYMHTFKVIHVMQATATATATAAACSLHFHHCRRRFSPHIQEIKVLTQRRVRRAKLYYLRDR
jgi:ribosomal protein L28